ncbi:MAG: phosphatidate cytidylyltransferase [Bacteroidetes bacterium]|jgi:CDP-diglyceride synthetase|nr:phosphatidate cytidylyltransferase [Bacteroidota bacterium]
MTNLSQRILTALLGGALLLTLLFVSPYSAMLACSLLAGLVYWEFLRLRIAARWVVAGLMLFQLFVFLGLLVLVDEASSWISGCFGMNNLDAVFSFHYPKPDAPKGTFSGPIGSYNSKVILAVVLFALLPLSVLLLAFRARLGRIVYTLSGSIYTTLPFVLWLAMFLFDEDIYGRHAYLLALAPLLFVWCSDTCGYFVGRSLGRHPIWPAISPKKSWEGLAGSVLGCMLLGLALQQEDMAGGILTGGILALATTAGDFLQSALKRRASVKDSGSLLPGHGGFYDRFDGFLLAMPVYLLLRLSGLFGL